MSTQYQNFSITEINFTAIEGDDLSALGTQSLTISPSDGYSISAGDFIFAEPYHPGIDIDSVQFVQQNENVILSFSLIDGYVMPAGPLEIPICLAGVALPSLYLLDGAVDIDVQNSTPLPVIQVYSSSGKYQESKNIYSVTVSADAGRYFYDQPTISIINGNEDNYTIGVANTTDVDGNVTAVTYNIAYSFPAENVSGDLIKIVGDTIEIPVFTTYINAFNVDGISGTSQPNVNYLGDTKTLNLIGNAGAAYTVNFIDNLNTTTLLGSGTLDSTGKATIENIIFPSYAGGNPPYEIVVSGDVNPAIANDGADLVITFPQEDQSYISISATSTNSDITIAESPSPIKLTLNSNYEYSDGPATLEFEITASSSNIITVNDPVTVNSFSPVIPDPLETDFVYSISNFSASLNNPTDDTYTISGTLEVNGTGSGNIAHIVNLDNHLSTVQLPTIVTSAITNSTGTEADSGGESITDGGGTISAKGIQWSTFSDFNTLTAALNAGSGTGDFTLQMTSLSPGTTYYVRAYATNEAGTAYGQTEAFVANVVVPCSSTASPGGAGITDTYINLDSAGGLIALLFDPEGVPDKLEIIHGADATGTKVATSGFDNGSDSVSGPFDNVYGTEPSNVTPASTDVATIDQFIGTNKGVCPTRLAQFEIETGYTVPSFTIGSKTYQQIVWWQYSSADYQNSPSVTIRVTGATGTSWTYLRLCCPDGNCTSAP